MPGRRRFWHALSMPKYWKGAHTKHRLQYHLVWIPKYRKRVLIGKVAVRLREMLWEAARVNAWYVHEVSIMPDHVHVMVQLDAKTSVAEAVQRFKGGSSFLIKREFPELEEWIWGGKFWADGYFAETVGVTHEEAVRRYIRDQAKHAQSMPS